MSWEGKVATLADRYKKGAEDLTIRSRLALKWLEKQGRIVLNCDAEYTYFAVQKAEPPVEGHAEAGVINFGRRNLWGQAKVPWRGYVATDMMYRQERMEAKGDVVLVNRYARIMEHLAEATRNRLHKDLYIDGNASGNENFIQGLNSFCGYTSGSTVAADKIAFPNDSYFGLSTNLATDGTWTSALGTSPNAVVATDWPDGDGDAEYDYWTPKLINTVSSEFGASTWSENCETCLRQAVSWLSLINGTSGSELVCIMAGNMMTDLKEKFAARNRQILPHKTATDLGFPQVLEFEGLALHQEFGVGADTGFIWNMEKAELCSLAKSLLFRDGPGWDIKEQAWLFLLGFYGNLRVKSPKYFAKLYPYQA